MSSFCLFFYLKPFGETGDIIKHTTPKNMEMATKFAVALETRRANNNYSETCSSRIEPQPTWC